MSRPEDDFLEKLEAIRRSYMEDAFPQQLTEVNEAVASFVHLSVDGGASLDSLHTAAHKLAGSSGTFGLSDLSVTARALSELTDTRHTPISEIAVDIKARIDALLEEINSQVDCAPTNCGPKNGGPKNGGPKNGGPKNGGPKNGGPTNGDTDCDPGTRLDVAPGEVKDPPDAGETERTVVFSVDPKDHDDRLDEVLTNNEYRIARADDTASLETVIAREKAVIVVADLERFASEAPESRRVLAEAKARENGLTVVFVSERHTLEARLSAVRAGGDAFLIRPVDPDDLIDAIDKATDGGEAQPFRVLVIDDDVDFSTYVEAGLRGAGFICERLKDTAKTLDVLGSFSPEIILLDLNMPHVDGRELAMVICQQEAFVGTPIVFLSAETRIETQVDVMGLGGNDFLTKPIKLDHLVGVLKSRAKRFRRLRSRMVQDSLTGLINHSTTKQLLDREIERSRRIGAPLSFAMIDIDHFKQVNDTYGHGVGDRVIRAVARLLKNRLRSIDIIGRMGGEEFGVALSGTAGPEAIEIFNQIREAFSDIEFRVDDGHFGCSFSCGIAEFPDCPSGMEILDNADKALYAAKRRGRNRVEAHRSKPA